MKSLPNPSWDFNGSKTVQSWQPEEIFPSLTSEDMDSVVEEMLRLFHPSKAESPVGDGQVVSPSAGKHGKNQPVVSKWNLEALENVAAGDFGEMNRIPGITGKPVRIAQDEKQRLVAEARMQAEQILLNAKKAAKEVVVAAQSEAEGIRQNAYASGHDQAVADLQKTVENAQLIADQLLVWKKETIQTNEPMIIEIVQKISRLIFGDGMVLENEVLQQNLDRVMRMAESLGDIRIYMNQGDVKILDPEWRKFQESLSGKKIQIIPSNSIKPGGCYIQGDMGVVDATVETQLESVLSVLNPDQKNEKRGLA